MKRVSRFGFGCLCLLGVFSAHAAVWYVDIGAPAGGNGTSWQTSYQTIQPAIDAASPGDEIWVAQGTYSEQRDPVSGAIIMHENVNLYGGFQGNETSLSQRDPQSYPTIISGSYALGGSAAQHTISLANNSRVDGFTIRGAISSCLWGETINGFTLANCSVQNNQSAVKGGGLLISGGDTVQLLDCRFYLNHAPEAGAIYLTNFTTIKIERCSFESNSTESDIFASCVQLEANDVTVSDSIFQENHGCALYAKVNNMVLQKCSLLDNSSNSFSASLIISDAILVKDCIFHDNNDVGGPFPIRPTTCARMDASDITIEGTKFINNESGGGLCLKGLSIHLSDTLFQDNTSSGPGAGLTIDYSFDDWVNSFVEVENSAFIGNHTESDGGAVYVASGRDVQTVFKNCVFAQNTAKQIGAVVSTGGPECAKENTLSTLVSERVSSNGDALHNGKIIPLDKPDQDTLEEGEEILEGSSPEGEFPVYDYLLPSFINCTVVGNRNESTEDEGIVYAYLGQCIYTLVANNTNCIFWDNTPEYPLFSASSMAPKNVFTYSLEESGQYAGEGNIHIDPRFSDPENGDYRLMPDSPCIDTGRNTSGTEYGAVTADLLGVSRPQDGDGLGTGTTGDGSDYDIGAYEYNGLGEGEGEGIIEGEGEGEGIPSEGSPEEGEGIIEGEGVPSEGSPEEGEGVPSEGEGIIEGEGEGVPSEGSPEEGEGQLEHHTADQNADYIINLSELLRVIQFFNSGGFHCETGTEDGYAPGPGDTSCPAHSSDYNPQDWQISLSELLRLIQFFNSPGYRYCPDEGSEDSFCPSVGAD